MKKCLIYARCSTSDQETTNQIAQLQDYANKQGWKVVEVIQDTCSGGKRGADRSGLTRAFGMAHRREIDILLFWSLDRLSREGTRATIQYLTTLEGYGVDWHSYTEQYLSSMGVFKDCIISLLSCLAKQEKIRISERTKAGLERTRKNGTTLGRPKIDEKIGQTVKSLREQGMTFAEIGIKMGVTRSRAWQLAKV